MKNWLKRRDAYQSAWKSRDATFAPDHRFDDLLVFLFPAVPTDLTCDPADILP
jgi:hypothetical protein